MASPPPSSAPFPGPSSVVIPTNPPPEPAQGTKNAAIKIPKASQTKHLIRSEIIDEPLRNELKIAIELQDYKKGIYKNAIKNDKPPIRALFEILGCQRLLPEERKAMQEYHDEAMAIYLDLGEEERDVSEYICQETWDALMDVFASNARIHQTGIAERVLKVYDDDEALRGWAIVYRDGTYRINEIRPRGEDGKARDCAKWLAAVEYLKENFEEKGFKKRDGVTELGVRGEYNSVLRLEFDS
ncbi:hypothetical protein HYFRA_00001400 [Hymenoscyphus fraxineus]|uniref:Uncharacterized protein n=1 Tax=Hymenoscyphus fraxineus TaxID=746836 RepID=A0A9N9L3W2_9HELO|nr:hypothetical protein HYFRA_00001400 [Hymenoscyphus fraxineus]